MDPDPNVTELFNELTDIEIIKLAQFLHLPLVSDEETKCHEFTICTKNIEKT